MAVVSDDHAHESLCAEAVPAPQTSKPQPRPIPPAEVEAKDGKGGRAFWAVVDRFVVDATAFLDSHPGGLSKLLSADKARTGATGAAFGFSFARGHNAHFPETGRAFHEGVSRYLRGGRGEDGFLLPCEVGFGEHGTIVILGRLQQG